MFFRRVLCPDDEAVCSLFMASEYSGTSCPGIGLVLCLRLRAATWNSLSSPAFPLYALFTFLRLFAIHFSPLDPRQFGRCFDVVSMSRWGPLPLFLPIDNAATRILETYRHLPAFGRILFPVLAVAPPRRGTLRVRHFSPTGADSSANRGVRRSSANCYVFAFVFWRQRYNIAGWRSRRSGQSSCVLSIFFATLPKTAASSASPPEPFPPPSRFLRVSFSCALRPESA